MYAVVILHTAVLLIVATILPLIDMSMEREVRAQDESELCLALG